MESGYLPSLTTTIFKPQFLDMILRNSTSDYDLEFDGTSIDIKENLKILGLCLDYKLSFLESLIKMLGTRTQSQRIILNAFIKWPMLYYQLNQAPGHPIQF